jgi:aminobenzoyl-glutamate utilization protein B
MQDNWERLGPPEFDDADRAFARQIRATLGEDDIRAPSRRAGLAFRRDQPLADEIVPFGLRGERLLGSTDVGDVSWVVPLVQADGPTMAIGTPFHSWQMTAHGKTPLARKGMVQTAKVMAATAIDAIRDAALVARAKADLAERTRETPYVCPIPPDVQPPIRPR